MKTPKVQHILKVSDFLEHQEDSFNNKKAINEKTFKDKHEKARIRRFSVMLTMEIGEIRLYLQRKRMNIYCMNFQKYFEKIFRKKFKL